jgi:glycerophosphoryl diester phosphodiesterase
MTRQHSIVRLAHRGASAQFPENTLLAFRKAIEQGIDMLELDIHSTADAHLVVIHDRTLERTTNGQGYVNDLTLQRIRQLDAGEGEKIPLFEEVIELAREAGIRLCVEIKGIVGEEELDLPETIVHALEAQNFLDQTVLTSFSPKALLRAKSTNMGASTMLDPSPQDGSLLPRQICAQALHAGANGICYDFQILTPAIVRECQLTGLVLWAWQPDEPDDLYQLLKLGVQGIMTNRPDVLNEVLNDTAL